MLKFVRQLFSLLKISSDKYGNFVVQQAIKLTKALSPNLHNMLIEKLDVLKANPNKKKNKYCTLITQLSSHCPAWDDGYAIAYVHILHLTFSLLIYPLTCCLLVLLGLLIFLFLLLHFLWCILWIGLFTYIPLETLLISHHLAQVIF
jgi:hypothetical protein